MKKVLFLLCLIPYMGFTQNKWQRFSTEDCTLESPNGGNQQTCAATADFNNDGINDFVIGERSKTPSMILYLRTENRWEKYAVDTAGRAPEAGACVTDVDNDGDMDIIAGNDYSGNEVWWYENPWPDLNPAIPWKRHLIKYGGTGKHHDIMAIDFDNDGKQEIVFWNQGSQSLCFARIPSDPRGEWEIKTAYRYDKTELPPRATYLFNDANEHEGLAKADIDGNGTMDIIGGASWFEYKGNDVFEHHIIDSAYHYSRCAAGQLIRGGRPEIVLVVGDGHGPLIMYRYDESSREWRSDILVENVESGHSLAIADFDGDGNPDIWYAEMRLNGGNPESKNIIMYGNGHGVFPRKEIVSKGCDLHESKIADLDGDGDLDILGKGYDYGNGILNIWLQNGTGTVICEKKHAFRGKVGLQLYSLRQELEEDTEKTVEKVAAYGFRAVELSGFYGTEVTEWKRLLTSNRLKCVSITYDWETFETNTDQIVYEAKKLGATYVGTGWIPHDGPFTVEQAHQMAERFNKTGERLRKSGLRFFYHPHGYEFTGPPGNTPADILIRESQARYVTFELDYFWVQHAGNDPMKLLSAYPGRFELAHLKDLRIDTAPNSEGYAREETSTVIGKGILNWPALLRTSVNQGCKYFFIEDESPEAVRQITESLHYLHGLK